MSGMSAATGAPPRPAQPLAAASTAATASALDSGTAGMGEQPGAFGAQMARAADVEQASQVELSALLLTTAPPEQTSEAPMVASALADGSAAEQSAPELTAEQWLLGMLGQQQAQVQARDVAAPTAAVPPVAVTLAVAPAPVMVAPASVVAAPVASAPAPVDPRVHVTPERSPALVETHMPPVRMASEAPAASAPAAVVGLEQAEPAIASQLDALLNTGEGSERAEPSSAAGERPAPSALHGSERLLKLQTPQARWGEQMLQALRDNVELQLQQKIQSATIRLDPPELGALEIHLSHESGRLHVQLTAAHADVARLLQQTSDRLRQELVGQNFVQVNVQVGADGQGQQGRGQPRAPLAEDLPLPAANAQQPASQARGRERAADVLVTV
ncbi:flagellar hook-length control protein FliK [Stutzerimonas stutzeri]|uniref:flagellar hook-length control protein FliK n=1 Tax=Stutzerimonas sp. S1 TaxID=3030652 RepID=UPI002224351E|nr:flagellar hook-length control protein FliK [Stutzerimonas sp. S1]MCW3150574.1 flagellar hook-length control protein FliK [Stutzerimonas sp. S1]